MEFYFSDVVNEITSHCVDCGLVVAHHLDPISGSLFVEFDSAVDAETTYTHLNGKRFTSRPLVITFFPPDLWNQRQLF